MRLSGNIMQKHWLGLKIDSFWVETNSRSNKLNQWRICSKHCFCPDSTNTANWSNFLPRLSAGGHMAGACDQRRRSLCKFVCSITDAWAGGFKDPAGETHQTASSGPSSTTMTSKWCNTSSGGHIGRHQLWPPAPTYCCCYETPQLFSAHSEKPVIWRFQTAIDPEGVNSLLLRWIRETAIFNVLIPNFTLPHWPADQCYVNKPTDCQVSLKKTLNWLEWNKYILYILYI